MRTRKSQRKLQDANGLEKKSKRIHKYLDSTINLQHGLARLAGSSDCNLQKRSEA